MLMRGGRGGINAGPPHPCTAKHLPRLRSLHRGFFFLWRSLLPQRTLCTGMANWLYRHRRNLTGLGGVKDPLEPPGMAGLLETHGWRSSGSERQPTPKPEQRTGHTDALARFNCGGRGDLRRQNVITTAGAGPGLCGERGDSFRTRCGFVNGLKQAGARSWLLLGWLFLVRGSSESCCLQQHGGSRALSHGFGSARGDLGHPLALHPVLGTGMLWTQSSLPTISLHSYSSSLCRRRVLGAVARAGSSAVAGCSHRAGPSPAPPVCTWGLSWMQSHTPNCRDLLPCKSARVAA